jgi:hypothetical protein
MKKEKIIYYKLLNEFKKQNHEEELFDKPFNKNI